MWEPCSCCLRKGAMATVYKAVGIDPHATLTDRQDRPVPIQNTGEAIPVF